MKNIRVVCLLIVLSGVFLSFGKGNTGCDTFLNLAEKGKVTMYGSTSKESVVAIVGHDFAREDYLCFTIHSSNDSMYYVTASLSIAGEEVKGWISKKTNLAVFHREAKSPLLIYKTRKRDTNVIQGDYTTRSFRVVDCKEDWLKVIIHQGKTERTGWLPPELQCSNPYTSCN